MNNNNNNNNPNRSQATTTTSSSTDFVLRWGNRKRLRCMKQQQQQLTKDEKLPLGQRSITARGDRRNKDSLSNNGGINLRQRSSVLRNCESTTIGMKGSHQSNGDNKRNNNHKNNNNSGNGSGGSSETGAKSSSGNEMMVWPPKFAIGLTNKEKEEDFLAIKGSKLPQRPKKRAKFIQRTINLVCPGGWLCDLTLERYEVREKKITKKRPRGLKAMGSIESESE